MKRILFDFQAFSLESFGGVSRMYTECLPFFDNEHPFTIGVARSNNIHLIESHLVPNLKPLPLHTTGSSWISRHHFPLKRTLIKLMRSPGGVLSNNKELCVSLLDKNNFDIFEPTFFDSYFLDHLHGKPFVITIHDMVPELFPQYYEKNDSQILQKRILCKLAAHIHVPSECTKRDLVNILNINPDNITVISRGSGHTMNSEPAIFNFKYLLYVGLRGGYKNFIPFLYSFAKVHKLYPDIHLVCTGMPFSKDEINVIHSLRLSSITHSLFATESEMNSLYQHAVAFVYPSAYEGFGLPILEAWANHCPVLLNEASCFPEVAGNAALFFHIGPKGSDDLSLQIESLLSYSHIERDALIKRGDLRLKLYSWNNTARIWQNIYDKI